MSLSLPTSVEISESELTDAINQVRRRNLIILSGWLSALFAAYTVGTVVLQPELVWTIIMVKRAVTCVFIAGLCFWLRSSFFPLRFLHLAGLTLTLTILANILTASYLLSEPQQRIYLPILLLIIGFSSLSLRWYVLNLGAVILAVLAMRGLPGADGWDVSWGYQLLTATLISFFVQRVRSRSVCQAEKLRLQNVRRTLELEVALADAEAARQKLAEALQSAQESERRYRTLVESNENIVYTHDLQGGLLSINSSGVRLLGASLEELLGRCLSDLVVAHEQQAFADYLEEVWRNGEARGLMWFVTRSGEERVWLYHSLLYHEEGRDPYVLGNSQDVTERFRMEKKLLQTQAELETRVKLRTAELTQINQHLKSEIAARERAEEALREAMQFNSEIIDNAGEGIIVYDRDLKVKAWNRVMESLTGSAAQAVKGKNIYELYPELAHSEVTQMHQRALEGETVACPDREARGKSGTNQWLAGTYAPHRNTKGEIIGLIALLRNVTARRQAEQELEEYAARLRRSNAELQDFANIASHDLQEPLRKVRAFGDRLASKYADKLGANGLDYIQRMQNATGRMQNLIDDLLTLSRVTTKAQPFVSVDLQQIVSEVISDLEIRIEQSGGKIEVNNLPVLEADPLQMRQILQNLIANALKFCRPDVSPEVQISAKVFAEAGETQRSLCRLTVADKGIGFDEIYLDRIFAVFQRLHGRNEYEGTGIGLAICRKIVERHQGSITAESRPGEGAKFIVTLPVRQTVAAEPQVMSVSS